MNYKIIRIKDKLNFWGNGKTKQYQVVEEYLRSNIFTKLGLIEEKIKHRYPTIPTIQSNKGGNYNSGYSSIHNRPCIGSFKDCERFIEILNTEVIEEKSDSYWRNFNYYYPCIIRTNNGIFRESVDFRKSTSYTLPKIEIYFSDLKIFQSKHSRHISFVKCFYDYGNKRSVII